MFRISNSFCPEVERHFAGFKNQSDAIVAVVGDQQYYHSTLAIAYALHFEFH